MLSENVWLLISVASSSTTSNKPAVAVTTTFSVPLILSDSVMLNDGALVLTNVVLCAKAELNNVSSSAVVISAATTITQASFGEYPEPGLVTNTCDILLSLSNLASAEACTPNTFDGELITICGGSA